jgi:putative hydrolase of the HAD superfamily
MAADVVAHRDVQFAERGVARVVQRVVEIEQPHAACRVWLFDLDNTLHDASHAAFGEMHVAIGDYIGAHLGVTGEAADRLRRGYWLRYGATLLGLVRHHGVRAAHFLEETHRLPGLEDRLRTCAHDRAALKRLPGRKFVLTNAPRAYAMRVLGALGLARLFDGVIAIDDMTMFGDLRPKPDARMLRSVAARLGVPPSRCVLVEDTLVHQKAARRVGMRAVWMQRYLGGRFRGTVRSGANAGSQRDATGRRKCAKPPYVYAKIGALRQLTLL